MMMDKVSSNENKQLNWGICLACNGEGKQKKSVSKKVKLNYQNALKQFNLKDKKGTPPKPPESRIVTCKKCNGSGLIYTDNLPLPTSKNYPHIAIIGAGIGGAALAIACMHRQIPFTLYERDISFKSRSQGYGLTLQQASKAMIALGIVSLPKGITSTKHVVHNTKGEIIGEWGHRKWKKSTDKTPKRTNIHIARQSLRLALLNNLKQDTNIQWGHQLLNYDDTKDDRINLTFKVNHNIITTKADLLVGADGIRSSVRKQLINDKTSPLNYLGCIVILGICSLKNLQNINSPLLDLSTVFQTANGVERIYMMPFDSESIMWQLSFPLPEKKAKTLNIEGPVSLKKEAMARTQWHSPIPEIIANTPTTNISGYPVYDRDLLTTDVLKKASRVTLLGDAAHPMSPFKGQGANQALLDALSLARNILKGSTQTCNWKEIGIKQSILSKFETEMIERTTSKVKDSATAAKLLHSNSVLQKGNGPRGKHRNVLNSKTSNK